ncbi:hypothetical protein GCM10023322_00930 [Rugosimonospora acidiphila]|uniref:DUF4190 domain-containing protein n=1 Tax=Rugosimonospora acidiphila TaxID=556531 RepID=A0ABP9RGT0_9ACTN
MPPEPLVPPQSWPTQAPPSGYAYNWGQGHPAPGYAGPVLIQRPPRPGVVNIAVILTYLGAGLSLVATVLSIISIIIDQDSMVTQVTDQTNPSLSGGPDPATVVHATVGIGIVISVVE